MRLAQRITRGHTVYPPGHLQHPVSQAKKIIKDPSHGLFNPLPSRRRRQYRCIKAGNERLKNNFHLQTIRLLLSHH
ncbi:unnamed protein product [Oncorhynchus mykiss]|uniref:Uncharacterized protein n=1 Tax=Oncorhynchus mykiss TaxID=8022 RepID=A0A060XN42_ONCMY|nr:unnamed protein product [Oncorhynchus mykiss]